jgi:hypothetical protein
MKKQLLLLLVVLFSFGHLTMKRKRGSRKEEQKLKRQVLAFQRKKLLEARKENDRLEKQRVEKNKQRLDKLRKEVHQR